MLSKCWKNPDAGYEIQPTDEWIVNNQHENGEPFEILEEEIVDEKSEQNGRRKPSTYGEITTLGARQLFGAMGLMDYSQENPPIHFFDLGSGTGKLVGQVVLELSNNSVKGTGVELSPSRHDSAVRSKNALTELTSTTFAPSFGRNNDQYFSRNDVYTSLSQNYSEKFELLQGDLFDADLSTATHIYVASLCFPHDLMVRLEDRLQTLLQQKRPGGTNASGLQWVATLQPFPNNLTGIRPLVRFMEMSWTKPLGCAVYLYRCNY